jgi:flagellar export protein FliJ
MKAADEDRGLRAVRRVREVRENDSRYGLSVALASVRERDAEAERARARIEAAERFEAGSVADFRGHVDRLSALVALESQAVARAHASRTVAAEAQRRWQQDRRQVRVVDLLLERRAAARTEERARREQAQLDDLASQGWLRSRQAHDQQQNPPRTSRAREVTR